MSIKLVSLVSVFPDRSPNPRVSLNENVVADYQEVYQSKSKMPPLTLFKPNGREEYLIADGWHRYSALTNLRRKECLADVHVGGYEEALKFALVANTTHGLRRSNDDKRKCVELALKQWPDLTPNAIAILCGVSHTFVDNFKKAKVATVATPKFTSGSESTIPTNLVKLDGKSEKSTDYEPKSPAKTEPKTETKCPEIPVDKIGYHIPEGILHLFQRGGEIKAIINQLHEIKRRFTVPKEDLILWRGFNFQDGEIAIDNLVGNLKRALPEIVCPQCQGHPDVVVCPICHGKGFVSEFLYFGPVISEKTRQVREKIIAGYTKEK